ncbi:MAG: thioredoxin family protein [Planctomycetaceae bacterium]|nr:thioredoxin family protein [Planctomycetaceae bacterium]
MFDFMAKWSDGLSYTEFLNRFATEEQQRRWNAVFAQVALTAEQKALLKSFRRQMIVPVLAGSWCGDCVQQCPIFAHIAAANPLIEIRYFDRDTHLDMADAVRICGGRRVPTVIFLSEEGAFCGLQGDRTITKYRELMAALDGATCPTGLAGPSAGVVQDWVSEFERVQAMVRLSPRLREKHGD